MRAVRDPGNVVAGNSEVSQFGSLHLRGVLRDNGPVGEVLPAASDLVRHGRHRPRRRFVDVDDDDGEEDEEGLKQKNSNHGVVQRSKCVVGSEEAGFGSHK